MTNSPTKLTTPFDFGAQGKHCDFIRLPHSVHRSAYGWLPLPVVCITNGDGPTVLVMAGTHGDEYEGKVTITRLAQSLEVGDIQGRLILLPMANYPAAKAGLRTSPIDDLNLNRVYPGDPDGSPTMMIAHYIETVLLEMSDYALDLHSGGSSLHYLPSACAGFDENEERTQRVQELMNVFGAPYGFIFPGGHTGGGSTTNGAKRQNTILLATEMGGSGTVTPDCLEMCFNGVARVLHETGVLKKVLSPPVDQTTRILHAPNFDYFVYARDVGLFEPVVELGDEVRVGDLSGLVHMPETPWRPPVEVRFDADGVVICKRIPGRVEPGDCVFHLGTDFTV
jgi:predicted deacylase